ncbi:small-conductance mechanosensitive channel [Methanofollis sp. W23]|uniref:mechanosensitive ion channel family protein n=1 Tax=Methanofollis sp. W23 TaxID=2817849 RepID=UPI001AE62D7A|nr:hypothetical protein [Methanofollis sp. W23]MBP2146114.1 small-conductance mechanosensitive channel [Methanofollis sp. W23]
MADIMSQVSEMVGGVVIFLPNIIAAIIILLIGWIIGRVLGKAISVFLDKIGVDDALRKTEPGTAIEKSGLSIVHLFDVIVRIFVYLIAITAATNVLQIESLSRMMAAIVAYIPNIVAFVLILVVGILLIDFFADWMERYGTHMEIALIGPMILLVRLFLYFVVIILALTQLAFDLTIIYLFIGPLAWGVGLGIGAAIAIIVGFGLKDRAPEIMDRLFCQVKK